MPPQYQPIADYAAIGNLRTVALVSRYGSIDWCCFPHLDRPSVFAAILDANRGGRFRIGAAGADKGEQRYLGDTNVLETRIQTGTGLLTLTDFIPLRGRIHGTGNSHGGERSIAPSEIHRILECSQGAVTVEVEWSPRFDYARAPTRIEPAGEGWVAASDAGILALGGAVDAVVSDGESGPFLQAQFPMHDGERRVLVTRWGTRDVSFDPVSSVDLLQRTAAAWKNWAHQEGALHSEAWAGGWLPMLIRSELALKLLTHAESGAIAAAPTTSLPEGIGGVRNWDYRYAWIRDASLTAQAFIALGHREEAIEFLNWIVRVSEQHFEQGEALQIMYGVHGEADLDELELDHLDGYRGSRPVRIGNGAAKQNQHEVYGELLVTGYELLRRGETLNPEILTFLGWIADHVCAVWKEPDHGIWEVRGEPRHYVYSKLMSWVALDYAVHLAERFGLQGDVGRWRRNRDAIRDDILEKGYDPDLRSFVMAYGSKELDAANLRMPMFEFLPFEDERVRGTVDATMEHLMENGLLYRHNAEDDLPGEEGTFALCTLWLVDVLALSGRHAEALEIYENMLGHANHAGLFAEQIDAETGEFLGNFPQAFTHIGIINSALYLAYAGGRDVPGHAPIGTPDHRRTLGRAHAAYHQAAVETSADGRQR
ncbi:MAG: glycoside hydrolase family 15 protein [Methanomicrobiales archaeon]|nr:glycoside hydrolase family 15 protein [Methanomicrobiales archaeon]